MPCPRPTRRSCRGSATRLRRQTPTSSRCRSRSTTRTPSAAERDTPAPRGWATARPVPRPARLPESALARWVRPAPSATGAPVRAAAGAAGAAGAAARPAVSAVPAGPSTRAGTPAAARTGAPGVPGVPGAPAVPPAPAARPAVLRVPGAPAVPAASAAAPGAALDGGAQLVPARLPTGEDLVDLVVHRFVGEQLALVVRALPAVAPEVRLEFALEPLEVADGRGQGPPRLGQLAYLGGAVGGQHLRERADDCELVPPQLALVLRGAALDVRVP